MRFFSAVLSVCLLVAGNVAAKKSAGERFDEYHVKAQKSSPLKLSEVSFKSLTSTPRDYSVAVLLTALDSRFNCQLCREFQPEWDIVAKSWAKGDKSGESRLLFGTLDFTEGREIFIQLGLQTAPVLMLYPPTSGPHATTSQEPLRFDFTSGPSTAEIVHSWLSRQLPDRPHPPIKRPFNFMRLGAAVTIVLGAGTALVTASPYVLPIVQNRNVWAAITMISILLFISGHMFNYIRKVPYIAGDGRGGFTYFVGGFQSQLGLETQIIAAIYGVMSFCAISLAVKVSRIADPKTQLAAVIAWGGILFFLYSFLLSIFRIKNPSYPFSLPPFM